MGRAGTFGPWASLGSEFCRRVAEWCTALTLAGAERHEFGSRYLISRFLIIMTPFCVSIKLSLFLIASVSLSFQSFHATYIAIGGVKRAYFSRPGPARPARHPGRPGFRPAGPRNPGPARSGLPGPGPPGLEIQARPVSGTARSRDNFLQVLQQHFQDFAIQRGLWVTFYKFLPSFFTP